jgi:hypothetical protein
MTAEQLAAVTTILTDHHLVEPARSGRMAG